MGLDQRRAAAVAFVRGIAGGAIDREPLAPGFDCWNNSMGGFISGDLYLEGIAKASAALPDMVMTIDGTVAEDNQVAVRSHSEGTLPNGDIYRNAYHFLFEFEEDRIKRIHAFLNTKEAAEKLMPVLWGDRQKFQ